MLVYFILGYGITRLNDRNPERRIQKGRRGEKRKAIEIRQSMASILVTCTSVAIGLFAQYQGWTFFSPWSFSWLTAVPLFLFCMVLFDAWFYFADRLLHTKAFYKYHLLRHRSVAPTVWSSDSIGLVDTALSQGYYAVITFLVPFPPIILLAHSSTRSTAPLDTRALNISPRARRVTPGRCFARPISRSGTG